eukprot:g6204.t1
MARISSRRDTGRGEWDDCPEIVGEALEWMATAAVGFPDVASVGPLTPVCKASRALIEAAKGASEAAENLGELISWCAFLVSVFIEHGKHVGDLAPVAKPLDEFVSTTSELAKRARVLASRSKYETLFHHKKGIKTVSSFKDKFRCIWIDIQGLSMLDIVQKKATARGPRMNANIGGDIIKLSLSPVLDLESLGEDEQHLFLSLVVLALGILAPAPTLTSWQKDLWGARKEAEFFTSNSPFQEVDESFRLHDLLLDFITTKCKGEGSLVEEAGNYAEDKPLLQRSLAIDEKVYGPDHPQVATDLNNLAGLLQRQGHHDEAKPLYKRSLAIRMKVLGPDHPAVSEGLNNLAGLLPSQGNYDEAKPFFQRSLGIDEKVNGPNHPEVATDLNNLAVLWQSQGHNNEAKRLYKRSSAIRMKVLGPDHPNVAANLNNLAGLLKTQGHYDEAKPLYKGSLAETAKVLGADHSDLVTGLNNLAELLQRQGHCDEARSLFKRSLAITEKVLGRDHPAVAEDLNNLTVLSQTQGNYGEAKLSLAIWEEVLSPDHPKVAVALINLAGCLESQGKFAEAAPLYERATEIWEKALGPDHSSVATILKNRARLSCRQVAY